MHTPINKVWNAIRKIKGKGTAEKYKHLRLGSISQTISKTSSKDNPKFTAFKKIQEKKFLDFISENKECYNEPFTFEELLQFLNNSHDIAVI